MPAVRAAGGEHRNTGHGSRNGRPCDRGLPANCQGVRENAGDRHHLRPQATDREQPGQGCETEGDDSDVLSRDGCQVSEPRGAEVVPHRPSQIAVVAEHDPPKQGMPISRDAACKSVLDARAQPIGDASDPAPPADHVGVGGTENDVYSSPCQPRLFVEAGLGPARRP